MGEKKKEKKTKNRERKENLLLALPAAKITAPSSLAAVIRCVNPRHGETRRLWVFCVDAGLPPSIRGIALCAHARITPWGENLGKERGINERWSVETFPFKAAAPRGFPPMGPLRSPMQSPTNFGNADLLWQMKY